MKRGSAFCEERSNDESHVRRSLPESPHEVRKPLVSERHIHAHAVTLVAQRLLQVAADAVEHLELKPIRRDAPFEGEVSDLAQNLFVVRRDGGEGAHP